MKYLHSVLLVGLLTASILLFSLPNRSYGALNCTVGSAASNQNGSFVLEPVVTGIDGITFIEFASLPGSSRSSMFIGTQTGIIYIANVNQNKRKQWLCDQHCANTTTSSTNSTTDQHFTVQKCSSNSTFVNCNCTIDCSLCSNSTLVQPVVFLNISSQLAPFATNQTTDEKGLLAMAFHPQFHKNGRFFLYYSIPAQSNNTGSAITVTNSSTSCNATAQNHVNALREFLFTPGTWSSTFNCSTSSHNFTVEQVRTLLLTSQPFSGHNGFQNLAFSEVDGKLYLATGDGGSVNDPFNAAQFDDSVLGKILSFDVDGIEEGRFLSSDTVQERSCNTVVRTLLQLQLACPFIARFVQPVSKGLRFPSGVDFFTEADAQSSILFEPEVDTFSKCTQFGMILAQIGQSDAGTLQIVNSVGSNMGWRFMEGSTCINQTGLNVCGSSAFNDTFDNTEEFPSSISVTLPIAELTGNLSSGEALIGGHLFRSDSLGCQLKNKYIFGNFDGQLYFVDLVPLMQTVFNLTDNSTSTSSVPFPFVQSLNELCSVNGTSSTALSDFRDTLLQIQTIDIGSTNNTFFTAISVSPDDQIFVGAAKPTGSATIPFIKSGTVFRLVSSSSG